MRKVKLEVPVSLCKTCQMPLEKKPHESMQRYLSKKSHAGVCRKEYAKKNRLGFFAGLGNTFDAFTRIDLSIEQPIREW